MPLAGDGAGQRSWHLGDYAWYILSCTPTPEAGVHVQCWSESGDEGRRPVEVSSGHGHAPSERYVDAARQALLRERGFELGGDASNFRERLVVADEINRRWSGLQASIDQDGDLVLETEVRLHGGVTPEHLRMRIDVFRRSVETIAEGRA